LKIITNFIIDFNIIDFNNEASFEIIIDFIVIIDSKIIVNIKMVDYFNND
jgi:hypothetical protein